jgi:O-methyltransferase involved in polyketide biosynthesis
MGAPQPKVQLTGVPETALWNLYHRAEAAKAGRLTDPYAIELVTRLNYPFERFSSPYRGLAARMHAQRVRTIDAALRRLLSLAPRATVVALGEGFETQFWRVDNGQLRWLSLDLTEVIAVRQDALPQDPRYRTVAGSATHPAWIGQVDPERPVILTAQGVFPYFQRNQVHKMLCTWSQRLPGSWLLFDAVTETLQATRRKNPPPDGYHPPEWTWVVNDDEVRQLRQLPGVAELSEVPQDSSDRLLSAVRKVPILKNVLPTFPVFVARLGAARS